MGMKENNVVTTKTRILSFELLQNLQPEISQRFRMELDAYVAGVSGEAWKKSSGGRKIEQHQLAHCPAILVFFMFSRSFSSSSVQRPGNPIKKYSIRKLHT
ncbi:hypothetical protein Hdeb2414_s0207g00832631 [Helianthus debilis subsp. tardiflorus]